MMDNTNSNMWKKSTMRVQDLFFKYANVMCDVQAKEVKSFQKYCRLTAAMIKEDLK